MFNVISDVLCMMYNFSYFMGVGMLLTEVGSFVSLLMLIKI